MTRPFAVFRDEAYEIRPVRQWFRAIATLAAASRFPVTLGTKHAGFAILKDCETSAAAL